MSDAARFSNLIQARCQPGFAALVERAAQARGMSHSEYVRQAARTALQLDGYDPATIAARDAGSLYNVVAGLRHWALVADGSVKATHRSADKPDDEQGGVWLPIEYEDAEPFHDDRHWRGVYETRIEPDRVVRTYPIVVKSLEAI